MEQRSALVFCLNPHQRHQQFKYTHQSVFCTQPGCSYLLEGASLERWQIISLLHYTQITDLYLATLLSPLQEQKKVCIKVLRSFKADAHIQVERLQALHHSSIHPLLAASWNNPYGLFQLISPYEAAGSLKTRLHHTSLSLENIISIIRQIAEALHYIHTHDLIHGRLKPENCLYIDADHIQINDPYTILLPPHTPITPSPYLAPEQNHEQTRPESDQYALGMLASLLLHHLKGQESRINDELPSQVTRVLRQAVQNSPQQRFPNVLSFANALQQELDLSAQRFQTPSLLLSPTPSFISSLSPVRLNTPPTGTNTLSLLPGHTSKPASLQWDSQGRFLASIGRQSQVRIWMIKQRVGMPVAIIPHRGNVISCSWSTKNLDLATTTSDGSIYIWTNCIIPQQTPTLVKAWWGHEGLIPALAWSPDGQILASGGSDKMLRFWDQQGNMLATFSPHGRKGITALAWSPDGQILATGGMDRKIMLWEVSSKQLIQIWEHHQDSIQSLHWSPDGLMLASTSGKKDPRLCLWQVQKGSNLSSWPSRKGEIIGISWSADSRWLSLGDAQGNLTFLNATNTALFTQQSSSHLLEGKPVSLAGSIHNELLAVGRTDLLIEIIQITHK